MIKHSNLLCSAGIQFGIQFRDEWWATNDEFSLLFSSLIETKSQAMLHHDDQMSKYTGHEISAADTAAPHSS